MDRLLLVSIPPAAICTPLLAVGESENAVVLLELRLTRELAPIRLFPVATVGSNCTSKFLPDDKLRLASGVPALVVMPLLRTVRSPPFETDTLPPVEAPTFAAMLNDTVPVDPEDTTSGVVPVKLKLALPSAGEVLALYVFRLRGPLPVVNARALADIEIEVCTPTAPDAAVSE